MIDIDIAATPPETKVSDSAAPASTTQLVDVPRFQCAPVSRCLLYTPRLLLVLIHCLAQYLHVVYR